MGIFRKETVHPEKYVSTISIVALAAIALVALWLILMMFQGQFSAVVGFLFFLLQALAFFWPLTILAVWFLVMHLGVIDGHPVVKAVVLILMVPLLIFGIVLNIIWIVTGGLVALLIIVALVLLALGLFWFIARR